MYSTAQIKRAIQLAREANNAEAVRELTQAYQQAMAQERGAAARSQPFEPVEYNQDYNPNRVVRNPEDSNIFQNIAGGLGAGAVGMIESASLGINALQEEEAELATREKINSIAERFRPDGGNPDSVSYKIASGLGSILAIAPAALLGPAALPVGAGIGIAAGAGEATERARGFGTSEEDRNTATRYGALIGITEILPLGRLLKAFEIPWLKKLVSKADPKDIQRQRDRIGNAFKTGTAEGAQELTAAVLQNLVAQGYNPEQELFEAGAFEEGAIGGAAGAILQGAVDLFARKGARLNELPSATPDDAAPTGPTGPTAPTDGQAFDDDPSGAGPVADATAGEVGLTDQDIDALSGGDPETVTGDPETVTGGPELAPEPTVAGTPTNDAMVKRDRFMELIEMEQESRAGRGPELSGAEVAEFEALNSELSRPEAPRTDGRQLNLNVSNAMGAITKEDRAAQSRTERAQGQVAPQTTPTQPTEATNQSTQPDLFAVAGEADNAVRRAENNAFDDGIAQTPQRDMFRAELVQDTDNQDYFAMSERQEQGRAIQRTLDEEAQIESDLLDEAAEPMRASQMDIDDEFSAAMSESYSANQKQRDSMLQSWMSQNTETNPSKLANGYSFRLKQAGLDPEVTADERTRINNIANSKAAVQADTVAKRDAPVASQPVETTPLVTAETAPAVAPAPTVEQEPVSGVRDAGNPAVAQAVNNAINPQPNIATDPITDAGVAQAETQAANAPATVDNPTAFTEAVRTQEAEKAAAASKAEPAKKPATKTVAKPAVTRKATSDLKPATKPETKPETKTVAKPAVTRKATSDLKPATKPVDKPKATPDKKSPSATKSKASPKKQATPEPTARQTSDNVTKPAEKGAKKDVKVTAETMPKSRTDKPKVGIAEDENLLRKDPKVSADMSLGNEGNKQFRDSKAEEGSLVSKDFGRMMTTTSSKMKPDQLNTVRDFIDSISATTNNAGLRALAEYRRLTDNIESALYWIATDLNVTYDSFKNLKDQTKSDKKAFGQTGKTAATKALASIEGLGTTQDISSVVKWMQETNAKYVRDIENQGSNISTRDKKIPEDRARAASLAKSQSKSDEKAERQEYSDSSILDRDFDSEFDGFVDPNDLFLPPESVAASAQALHPIAQDMILRGDLKGALEFVAAYTNNKDIKRVARALANNIGETTVEVVENLNSIVRNTQVAGVFSPMTNTIELDLDNGMNIHTLLHESTHAVTSHRLSNKSDPITKKLTAIYEASKGYLENAYGATNLDEFVAEAFSNPEFQTTLSNLRPDGRPDNIFQEFATIMQNMVRRFLGMSPTTDANNAKTEVEKLINSLMSPAPTSRLAGQLNLEKRLDQLAKETLDGRDVGKISRANLVKNMADFFSSSAPQRVKQTLAGFAPMQPLADIAQSYGFGRLGYDLDTALLERKEALGRAEKRAGDIVVKAGKLLKKLEGDDYRFLNTITYNDEIGSTMEQVDPFLTEKKATETYGLGSQKLEIWARQQEAVEKLSPAAVEYYEFVKSSFKSEFERVKDAILFQIKNAGGTETTTQTVSQEILTILTKIGELSEYMPLARQGEYKLSYQLKDPYPVADPDDLDSVETVSKAIKNNRFVTLFFDSKYDRDRVAKNMKDETDVETDTISTRDGDYTYDDFEKMPPASFVRKTLSMLRANGVEESIQTDILRLFVETMPENSFQRTLQGRKKIKGFIPDIDTALKSKIYNLTRQVARYKHDAKLSDIERQIKERHKRMQTIKNSERDDPFNTEIGDNTASPVIYKEFVERILFARSGAKNPQMEKFVRFGTQYAFLSTIGGSIASVIANMSQIPVIIFPALAAKYGMQRTTSELEFARRLVMGAKKGSRAEEIGTKVLDSVTIAYGIDAYYDITHDPKTDEASFTVRTDMELKPEMVAELEALIPMVKLARDRNMLDDSLINDQMSLNDIEEIQKGNPASKFFNGMVSISAMMFNQGERFNRQITLLASYNLNLGVLIEANDKASTKKPLAELRQEAAEASFHETQELNGGNVLETTSRYAQQGIGRMALMYKGFGINMAYTQLKMLQRSSKLFYGAETKEDVAMGKIAAKQLTAIFGSALFMSGVYGVPIYGAVQVAVDLFRDDDEDDFDKLVEDNIGSAWYRGALNQILDAAGVPIDIGSRIRLADLIFQTNLYNPDASPEETIAYYLGGVPWSMVKKTIRGVNDLREGDYQRGIEAIIPTALSNPLKTFNRYMPDFGIKTRRGDYIYGELSMGELGAQIIGFPPAAYLRQQEINRKAKGIDIFINQQATKLTKKYYVAARNLDYDTMEEVMSDIRKFNGRNPAAAITEEAIIRSLKSHADTSATMYNGVTLSKKYQDIIEGDLQGVYGSFSPVDNYFNRNM